MGSSGVTHEKAMTIQHLAEAVARLADASSAHNAPSERIKASMKGLLDQIDRITGQGGQLPAQD